MKIMSLSLPRRNLSLRLKTRLTLSDTSRGDPALAGHPFFISSHSFWSIFSSMMKTRRYILAGLLTIIPLSDLASRPIIRASVLC